MARYRVGLLGATGETGTSVLKALVEDAGFVRQTYIFTHNLLRD